MIELILSTVVSVQPPKEVNQFCVEVTSIPPVLNADTQNKLYQSCILFFNKK